MRTNIDIDDELLQQAMEVTGLASKKATVEEALRRTVNANQRRAAVLGMIGMAWEGDETRLKP